VVASGKI
jgi:hypothetical protein